DPRDDRTRRRATGSEAGARSSAGHDRAHRGQRRRQRACRSGCRRDGSDEDGERAEGGGRRRRRTHSDRGGSGGGEGRSARRVRGGGMSERARWESETVRPFLERQPERKQRFETASGLAVERLYSPDRPDESIGFPGEFPFTRGVYPTMYRGRLWTMRQYAGFGTAEETNRRYHYLLDHGQTGLSVAFDLPTQMGYDADAPMAAG